jgi:predicted phosphodiesterase
LHKTDPDGIIPGLMSSQITLVHLSDLHFSAGAYRDGPDHSHSIPHLTGIEKRLRQLSVDRVIVSGDITEMGDPESMLRAHDWLFRRFDIGGGQSTGLDLPCDHVILVPGNHDAYNSVRGRQSLTMRGFMQRSIRNYNDVFIHHKFRPDLDNCQYHWIEQNGCSVFVVCVDTCYLGDPALDNELLGGMPLSKVAKGKLSRRQSQRIMSWYDRGIKGNLADPSDPARMIPKEAFVGSFKIIVMHHYIFEPNGYRSQYFLRMDDRYDVFRNFAMIDADCLLCGHRHISFASTVTYGEYFQNKGFRRYCLNYLRRILGMSSLPIQLDVRGRRWSKNATMLIFAIYRWIKRSREYSPEEYLNKLADLLRKTLQDPDAFSKDLGDYIYDLARQGQEPLALNEISSIQAVLRTRFSEDERRQIGDRAEVLTHIATSLSQRRFLQSMAGSAAKKTSSHKSRSFDVLTLRNEPDRYALRIDSHTWNEQIHDFDEPTVKVEMDFPHSRVLRY